MKKNGKFYARLVIPWTDTLMKGWDCIGENPNCWINKGVDCVIAEPPILYLATNSVINGNSSADPDLNQD
jgi:hypothetical protein